MIAAHAIEYNTIKNTDLNLVVDVAFDSDEGETDSFLEREAISTTNYNGKLKRVYGYKYTNTFSPKFTFVKNDFSNISFDEQREIYAWLTSKSTPSFLKVFDAQGAILFECLGAFIEPKPYKLANNRTVGVTAVFESVLPWAVSQLQSYELKTNQELSITHQEINVSSDDLESPVYPKITIKQDSSRLIVVLNTEPVVDDMLPHTVYSYYHAGEQKTKYYWKDNQGTRQVSENPPTNIETTSVKIINEHNGTQYKLILNHNIVGETIILDGANKIVSSSRLAGRTLGNDFTWNWLPLLNGQNKITVIGNCEVELEFREPIKIGEW